MTAIQRRNVLVIGAAIMCLAPLVVYPLFLIKLMCFALLAASVNLLIGYAGLLSFGHAMFYGIGSYTTGYLLKELAVDGVWALVAGVLVAAALGFFTGLLAIRRQGIAFSMITLAFAQLIYFFALRLPQTGGEEGMQPVPRPVFFGILRTDDNLTMYYVALVLVCAGLWLIYRIVHSPFGQILKAIRDNEARAMSLGYRVNRYKLVAFTLSAAIAGLAGATKVMSFQLATLVDVSWTTSAEALLISIVGGLGTLLGPVVGAMIIVSMEHYLAAAAEWVLLIQGAVFVVVVMLFRRGIVGQFYWAMKFRTARKPGARR